VRLQKWGKAFEQLHNGTGSMDESKEIGLIILTTILKSSRPNA
jgi:hypothetical protein